MTSKRQSKRYDASSTGALWTSFTARDTRQGAAALERVRNNLIKLAWMLEGFSASKPEHDMASPNKPERPDARSEIECEIPSRAETLRRTLES